ncbi:MAG: glycosyltransferase family 4 protein [Tannerella sp.]|nr:glycosyltransferase family 4 protein [Tannerella sp.]
MRVAFDAKRAFHNHRGLGNYSRNMIRILSESYSENEYFLLNPKVKKNIDFPINRNNTKILYPKNIFYKMFPALWRSYGCISDINALNINIFHGLSQELPLGIHRTKIKTVATVHDTIFMRYPEQYDKVYRNIFIKKNKYIAKNADKIIAISETTKQDFIHFFNAEPDKIDVVYQGCNNLFHEKISREKLAEVRVKFRLPDNYLLAVGAIEPRKNMETILKSIKQGNIALPFVIVGKETNYLRVIKQLIMELGIEQQIIFLHNVSIEDLPAIYKMSDIFIYLSMFEGFGIPIVEALSVGVPVITTRGGVFKETGGNTCLYVDYDNIDEMAAGLELLLSDQNLRKQMIDDGLKHVQLFSDENIAKNILKTYHSII